MTRKQNEEILKKCFEDVIWMAIRYAHGRHTYAPSMVRDAVNAYKEMYPDFELKEDQTIQPPNPDDLGGFSFQSDYLNDLFENND